MTSLAARDDYTQKGTCRSDVRDGTYVDGRLLLFLRDVGRNTLHDPLGGEFVNTVNLLEQKVGTHGLARFCLEVVEADISPDGFDDRGAGQLLGAADGGEVITEDVRTEDGGIRAGLTRTRGIRLRLSSGGGGGTLERLALKVALLLQLGFLQVVATQVLRLAHMRCEVFRELDEVTLVDAKQGLEQRVTIHTAFIRRVLQILLADVIGHRLDDFRTQLRSILHAQLQHLLRWHDGADDGGHARRLGCRAGGNGRRDGRRGRHSIRRHPARGGEKVALGEAAVA